MRRKYDFMASLRYAIIAFMMKKMTQRAICSSKETDLESYTKSYICYICQNLTDKIKI